MSVSRDLRTAELRPLIREVVLRGGHLEIGVRGDSMAPTICDGDRLTVGPAMLSVGSLVLAGLRGELILHRLLRLEAGLALVAADGCRRRDWLPIADILGEVKRVQRVSRWAPLQRRLRIGRLAQAAALILAALFAGTAHAACTYTPYIVIDGQICDWATGENPLVFNFNGGVGGIPLQDAELTDDYNSTNDSGNLYGLEQFVAGTTFAVNDQVGLFLDIPGGPAVDAACNANAALTYTCTANPCTTAANWTAIYYTGLSGDTCQTGAQAQTLNTTGTGGTQQAAFALSGTNVEFGVSYAAIGLPTTYLATPFSTTNLNTNAQLSTLAQQSYASNSVGPAGALVTRLAARADRVGVTVGWLTHGEFGNLGFALYRARGDETPKMLSFQRGRIHAFEDWAYRMRDLEGRPGDRYFVADLDQHRGKLTWHGPSRAVATATLPEQPGLSRHAGILTSLAAESLANANVSASSAENPPTFAARLGVTAEGMYAIADDALTSANIARPTSIALTHAGQPMTFVRQPGGLTLFYAGPVANAYDGVDGYLLADGVPPVRSGTLLAPSPGAPLAATVSTAVHLKQDLSYDWDAPGPDPYVWAWASNLFPLDPVTFDAPEAATALDGSGTLVAHLVGGTTEAHHVQLSLNGVTIGETAWTGFGTIDLEVSIPPGLLLASNNTLTLAPIFDTGADYEFALLESVDLAYDRLPVAANGEARFTLPAATCVEVAGLGATPEAWEVTNPAAAVPLTTNAATTGSLALCSPSDGSAHLYEIFDESGVRTPTVRGANPSRWAGTHHVVDELVIVHPSLEGALQPLVAARRAQGLEVTVATLPDIDDAFASGEAGPAAIRSFLANALQTWTRPPRYVLLVGGANGDPKDVLGTGVTDLVPTAELVAGAFEMRSASDTWYVAGVDGVTPQVAIGRLPVDSVPQLDAVVQKLLVGDGQGPATGQSLLVTDMPGDGDADFPLESSVIANQLVGAGLSVQSVSAGDADPAAEIAASLTANLDLWHYIGHAGTNSWGDDFLLSTQVSGFVNPRLPLLLSIDCLDGEFDNPTATPVGVAAALAPLGGALAAFVSSTVESPRDGHPFDVIVVSTLLSAAPSDRLGDVILRAQQAAAAEPTLQELVETYNLIGDPASPVPLR